MENYAVNKVKDPSIRRNSNRLTDYDYSQGGAYFVTIVTQNRLCLFGSIIDGEMVLNEPGRMVEQVCQELPGVIAGVEIGTYQIMPNHFHAIIWLIQDGGAENFEDRDMNVGADLRVCPARRVLREATTALCVLRKGLPLRILCPSSGSLYPTSCNASNL